MSQPFLRKSLMAAAIVSASTLASLPAQAYQFEFDNPDWTGHLDTTLSVGALWRVESQDPKLAANGVYSDLQASGNASQIDRNDSDNNFDPGLASLVYKITPSLHLSWKDTYGAIVSGTYFYDQRIMDGTRDGGYSNCPGTSGVGCTTYPDNSAGDSFSDATKRYAGHYGRMLDTYVWGNFNLGQMPLTVKAGRQVINWGEALFIIGGVNQANYYDRNALMLPGSEIREALLPLDALYFNLGLTEHLTAEAFYQFDWKPNFDAPEGSYWATSDSYPGHGAEHVIIDGEAVSMAAAQAFGLYNTLNGRTAGVNYDLQQDQVSLKRADDQDPKDSGQFGLALKYLAENLNYTNFSFYFTNTHAKIPVVGTTVGDGNWYASTGQTACAGDSSCIGALNTAHMIDTTRYFLAYPEDIQTYGFSFNTSIGKLALSGEISYEPSRYIINEMPDNLIAEVAGATQGLSNSTAPAHLTDHCVRTKIGGDCIPGGLVDDGGTYYFYDTVQSYIGSLVGIYTAGPTLGTDNLILVMEAGMEHLEGLNDKLHYASTASVLQIEGDPHANEGSIMDPDHPWATYLDATSWGYRAVLMAEYNNLIPQTTFTPSIRLAHDVRGNSAIGGNFMEGRKAATLTLDFLIANKFDVSLSGTSFWGANYSNKLGDRDNVSLAASYSF